MPSNAPTIVQQYIHAAIEHALVATEDDDTVNAYVPEIPGVRAFGRDLHECVSELYRLIDMGIPVWLANGHELPVFEGIDLNTERGQILATYHRSPPSEGTERTQYANDDEMDAAFQARMKSA